MGKDLWRRELRYLYSPRDWCWELKKKFNACMCVVLFGSRLTMECRACSVKRSSFAAFVAGSLFEIECRQVVGSRFVNSNGLRNVWFECLPKDWWFVLPTTVGFATGRKDLVCSQQLPHTASSTTGKEELLPRVLWPQARIPLLRVATTGGLGVAGVMSPR